MPGPTALTAGSASNRQICLSPTVLLFLTISVLCRSNENQGGFREFLDRGLT